MTNSTIQYHLLSGFEDPQVSPEVWNELLSQGSSDVVFMTWHWQKTWWEIFGRGKLLLIMAAKDDQPVAIAPLFSDEGMIFFVGSGGSDYLDIVGDISNPEIVTGLLNVAIANTPGVLGLRFYHIPPASQTKNIIDSAAKNLGWDCFDEGGLNCSLLSIKDFPELTSAATSKKSLLRHEAWFNRNGGTQVQHFTHSIDILPQLEAFFEQHIARWAVTPFPSLFLDPLQRRFYRELCEAASDTGWLRFTVVLWQQQAIAFHFGMNYKGSFLWYKPCFDITLAKHSPGEVLLRQLLLNAIEEHAAYFDFGLGDEAFKNRFASSTQSVTNIGLYPPSTTK